MRWRWVLNNFNQLMKKNICIFKFLSWIQIRKKIIFFTSKLLNQWFFNFLFNIFIFIIVKIFFLRKLMGPFSWLFHRKNFMIKFYKNSIILLFYDKNPEWYCRVTRYSYSQVTLWRKDLIPIFSTINFTRNKTTILTKSSLFKDLLDDLRILDTNFEFL